MPEEQEALQQPRKKYEVVRDLLEDIVPPRPHDFLELASPDTRKQVWVYPEPLQTADPEKAYLLEWFSDAPTQAALLAVGKDYLGVNARLGSLREELAAAASKDTKLYRDNVQCSDHPTDHVLTMIEGQASLQRVRGAKILGCPLEDRRYVGPAYELEMADPILSSQQQKTGVAKMMRGLLAGYSPGVATVWNDQWSWSLDVFDNPLNLYERPNGFFDRTDSRFFAMKGEDKIKFSSVWCRWQATTLGNGKGDGYLRLWARAPSHHSRLNGIVVWTDEDPKK